MLDRDQIRQLILHENRSVRYEAAQFFVHCANPPADLADTFWASFDRYRISEVGIGWAFDEIPQTPYSCDRIVERLAGHTSQNEVYYLVPVFAQIPMDYLLAHRDRVLAVAEDVPELPAPRFGKPRKPYSTSAHLLRRLELLNTPPQQVWDELAAFSVEVDELARSEWDQRIDQRLYEALLRHPQFTIEKSLAVIAANDESWLRIFALDFLEILRHRPSIPLFFSLLDSDSDSASHAAQKALVGMADQEIIATLQSTYASAGDTHRMMIAVTLGNMGLPESEQALLALAQREDLSEENRTWIADGLVSLFTTEGFDLLRQWAKDENYDTSILDLHDNLPILATAIGRDLPEAATWPKGPRTPNKGLFAQLLGSDSNRSTPLPARLHKLAAPQPLPQPVKPHSKVGRNDPCPCGSGKKHKKCCGR